MVANPTTAEHRAALRGLYSPTHIVTRLIDQVEMHIEQNNVQRKALLDYGAEVVELKADVERLEGELDGLVEAVKCEGLMPIAAPCQKCREPWPHPSVLSSRPVCESCRKAEVKALTEQLDETIVWAEAAFTLSKQLEKARGHVTALLFVPELVVNNDGTSGIVYTGEQSIAMDDAATFLGKS